MDDPGTEVLRLRGIQLLIPVIIKCPGVDFTRDIFRSNRLRAIEVLSSSLLDWKEQRGGFPWCVSRRREVEEICG